MARLRREKGRKGQRRRRRFRRSPCWVRTASSAAKGGREGEREGGEGG